MARPRMGHGLPVRGDRDGFTFVEALVSLIVLVVGLLVVSQLFAYAVRASSASYTRTVTQIQVLDLGERMWLNLADPHRAVVEWQEFNRAAFPGWDGTVSAAGDGSYEIVVRAPGAGSSTHYLILPQEGAS